MKFLFGVLFGFYVAMIGVDNFSKMVENVVITIKQSVKTHGTPAQPPIQIQPVEPIRPTNDRERVIEA